MCAAFYVLVFYFMFQSATGYLSLKRLNPLYPTFNMALTEWESLPASSQVTGSPKEFAPSYYKKPLKPRAFLNKFQKKDKDTGTNLRIKYLKLRLLTREEEISAGKFSVVGKKLEANKKALCVMLGREPSIDEWAQCCNLSVEQLTLYIMQAMKARRKLVQHNMRMVDHYSRRILEFVKEASEVSYVELVAEGLIGLTKAAENYNGQGTFYDYAAFYVRSSLYQGLSRLRPGHMSSHAVVMFCAKANKAQIFLYNRLKRKPTDEELAAFMRVKVDTLKRMQKVRVDVCWGSNSKMRVLTHNF